MKKIYLLSLITFSVFGFSASFGQENDSVQTKKTVKDPLRSVNQMPEFPGGKAALMSFLSSSVQYPEQAAKANIQGQVVVEFVVDAQGYTKNFTIKKSLGYGCDEEVIRVLKAMPRWRPGSQNGKNVSVYYLLPMTFRLPPNTDTLPPTAIKDTILRSVTEMPAYPGGVSSLKKFIKSNIKYPALDAEGNVVLEFVVNKDGSLTNIIIKGSLNPECDAEAIRLVEAMPNWIPGKHYGKLVPVRYIMPIPFKARKDKK